jgi:transcriptional regulator with XRE-family HTH domain
MNQCPALRGAIHGVSAASDWRNTNSLNRRWRNTMATAMLKSSERPGPGRMRAQDTDRHVGARMRERRMMLGLTQHQMAEVIGVTYQQAHKYEKGINRVAAGHLYHIARALGVEVGYFFEGLGGTSRSRRRHSSGCCWRWRTISSRSQFASTKMPSTCWLAPWPTPAPATEPATRRACSAASCRCSTSRLDACHPIDQSW